MPKRNNPGCGSSSCCGCLWLYREWYDPACGVVTCADGSRASANEWQGVFTGVPDTIFFYAMGEFVGEHRTITVYESTGWSIVNGKLMLFRRGSPVSGCTEFSLQPESGLGYGEYPMSYRVSHYFNVHRESCPSGVPDEVGEWQDGQFTFNTTGFGIASNAFYGFEGSGHRIYGNFLLVPSFGTFDLNRMSYKVPGLTQEVTCQPVGLEVVEPPYVWRINDSVICDMPGDPREYGTLTLTMIPDDEPEYGPNETGDERLVMSGDVEYDSLAKEILMRGGGKLRSTEELPYVSTAHVAVVLTMPPPEETSDGGYGYGTGGKVIRLFFESDDEELNYKYVDLRELTFTDPNGTESFWRAELGTRTNGVDSIYHYEYVLPGSPSYFPGRAVTEIGHVIEEVEDYWEYWLGITRRIFAPGSRDEYGFEGYQAYLLGLSERPTDEYSMPSPVTQNVLGLRWPWFQEDSDLNFGRGVSLEVPLSDPAGTHFGITRLDGSEDETRLHIIAAGRDAGENCFQVTNTNHAPCLEMDSVKFVASVSSSSGTFSSDDGVNDASDDIVYRGNQGVRSTLLRGDTSGDYDVMTWGVNLRLRLIVSEEDTTSSQGQETCFLEIRVGVTEQTHTPDHTWTGGSPPTSGRYNLSWTQTVELLDHAESCGGFSVTLDVADAAIETINNEIPLMFSSVTITGVA